MSQNRRTASPPPAMPTERVYGDTDPRIDQYSKGDTESWAEGVRRGPYRNSPPPAMPTETVQASPDDDLNDDFGGGSDDFEVSQEDMAVLEKRAKKCITIAQCVMDKRASKADMEEQVLSMMDWSDRQINAAYEKVSEIRTASKSVVSSNDDDEDDEDGEDGEELEAPPSSIRVPSGKETRKPSSPSDSSAGKYNRYKPKKASADYGSELFQQSKKILASVDSDTAHKSRISSILRMAEPESSTDDVAVDTDYGTEERKPSKPTSGTPKAASFSKEASRLKTCLDQLSEMPEKSRLLRIAALGRLVKMADERVRSLFNPETIAPVNGAAGFGSGSKQQPGANEFSELSTMVSTGQLGKGSAPSSMDGNRDVDIDWLGGETELSGKDQEDFMGAQGELSVGGPSEAPVAPEPEEMDFQEDVEDVDQDDDEFETGDEDGMGIDEEEEEDEDEDEWEEPVPAPAPVQKTASKKSTQKPKPKPMSRTASPKKLGAVVVDNSSEVRNLSSLWSSAPDVSEYFGTAATSTELKDGDY